MKPEDVVHLDRYSYWIDAERAQKLAFLIKGPVEKLPVSPWINDTPQGHFDRIVRWCTEKNYDLISVSLSASKRNPLPWHIEMVVMPDLQPMHQTERFPYLDGPRLKDVPKQFGYSARSEPFADEPHPFA